MPTFRRTTTTWNDDEKVATATVEVTADGEVGFSGLVAKNTEPEVDLVFPFAKVKGIVLKNAGPAAVEINTNANAAGAHDDTFALAAGAGLSWMYGDAAACPITVDVTKLFIDNNDVNLDANVTIAVLLDVTP